MLDRFCCFNAAVKCSCEHKQHICVVLKNFRIKLLGRFATPIELVLDNPLTNALQKLTLQKHLHLILHRRLFLGIKTPLKHLAENVDCLADNLSVHHLVSIKEAIKQNLESLDQERRHLALRGLAKQQK